MPTRTRNSIPLARSVALAPFVSFLDRGGGSVQAHLRATRIDPEIFHAPESLLPLQQAAWFIDRAGRREDLEDFGFQVGAVTPILSLGLFGSVLAQSLTMHELIQRLIAWAPALNSGVRVELIDRGGPTVEVRVSQSIEGARRHVDDFSLFLALDAFRLVLGPDWRPKEVELSDTSCLLAGRHEMLSEARCSPNDTHTAVRLPRAALNLPLRGRLEPCAVDPKNEFSRTSPAKDFAESVAMAIESMLGIEAPTIETTAEIGGMSVRTLQRRLGSFATTFEEITDRVRFEKALQLLADPTQKLSYVSERLGYADPANFTRAFRRWTGSTPGAYRERQFLGWETAQ